MNNKSSDLVLSGIILAKIAEFEPINSKYSWGEIIVIFLICVVIDAIFNSFYSKE